MFDTVALSPYIKSTATLASRRSLLPHFLYALYVPGWYPMLVSPSGYPFKKWMFFSFQNLLLFYILSLSSAVQAHQGCMVVKTSWAPNLHLWPKPLHEASDPCSQLETEELYLNIS